MRTQLQHTLAIMAHLDLSCHLGYLLHHWVEPQAVRALQVLAGFLLQLFENCRPGNVVELYLAHLLQVGLGYFGLQQHTVAVLTHHLQNQNQRKMGAKSLFGAIMINLTVTRVIRLKSCLTLFGL